MPSKRRKRTIATLIIALSLLNCLSSYGQITLPGNPLPPDFPGLKPLMIYDITVPTDEIVKAAAGQNPLFKGNGNGTVVSVDYDIYSSGQWDTLADGTKIWRAAFRVHSALSMNIVFGRYKVKSGVRVYVSAIEESIGAFSDLNNKSNGLFATGILATDISVVEVHVPAYLDNPGEITITGIGCSFEPVTSETPFKDAWFGLSGDCNADINCYNRLPYSFIKNSVVRIVFNGGQRCTGTLVNNTGRDATNYVLTAKHCIGSEFLANTAVFYFNYESPFCGGPDGDAGYSVSGSTIRSKGDELDFVLLQLLEDIPFYYHPVYAGWDVTGTTPASGYSIHHPEGDVKKISFESHQLQSVTFSSQFIPDSHWLVRHWETGTTEEGSSGSPIFNTSDRITGTLTGGQAECGDPVRDYYQKISYSWDYYTANNQQLKYWLDPEKSGNTMLDAFDPYADLWRTGDTLSNISVNETLAVEKDNLVWGALSGHNSQHFYQFAEKFDAGKGEAVLGVMLDVADNVARYDTSSLRIRIWEGGDEPGLLISEKKVLLPSLEKNAINFVQLDSVVNLTGSFYVGYELFYNVKQDTFSLQMAENRETTLNTAYVYDGTDWYTLDNYTSQQVHSSFAVMPVVFDIPEAEVPPDNNIIYPNPAGSEFNIKFSELTQTELQLYIYNISGQVVYTKKFPPYQDQITITGLQSLSSGFYIVKLVTGSEVSSLRLILVR